MKIDYLNKELYSEWNEFVEQSPQGSVFSNTFYLDALQVNYKILVVTESEDILAGIVLTKNEVNTYSNPMLDKYLGVLFKDYGHTGHKIIEKQYKALTILTEHLKKYKSFDYYFHPEFTNWIPFYWNNFSQQTRYTYRINLEVSEEKIFSRFHPKLRNDIKNAINNNVKIMNDVASVELYNLVEKTFIRQGGSSPFNSLKITNLIETMRKIKRFISFGAYDSNNRMIAACGILYDSHTAYLLLNGIDIEKHIRGANALMIFEAIKHFRNKTKWFDFEGSMLNGVEQFYRRFGGELTPYYRIWNDNFFNYAKSNAKKIYKKIRYGR